MPEDGSKGRAALTAALGEAGVSKLDEAGVLDYCAEALEGDDADEELAEMLGPMLLEAGAADTEEEAEMLCTSVLGALRGEVDGAACAKPASEAFALLTAPISLDAMASSDDHEIRASIRSGMKVVVNFNKEFARGSNDPIKVDDLLSKGLPSFSLQLA